MSRIVLSLALLAGFLLVPGSQNAPAGAAPPGACANIADSELAAMRMARACQHRVEVASARAERSSVFAEPNGRTTFQSYAVPQRARRAGGDWAPIDLVLRAGADKALRPNVSVADVRFSGGGAGAAVAMGEFGLAWPGKLPAPVVSGDTATYPEVLPGVDLVLRATRTGFSHVVVVKNVAAASNPAVRRLRFANGGAAHLRQLPNGVVQAVTGGKVVANARGKATMWDATGATSTAAEPGDYARLAKVGMKVEGGELILTPDPAMLDSPATTFPIYVDPPWDTSVHGAPIWAYANSDNDDNEYSRARVGLSPGEGIVYRSFFDFPVDFLWHRHIENAHVYMLLDHSHLCYDSANGPTDMYHAWEAMDSPRTDWSKPLHQWMSQANSHANQGGACTVQPDADVNFADASTEHNSVTDIVQAYANNRWDPLRVGFRANNEGSLDGWRKFYPEKAMLKVDYSTPPGQPNGLAVSGTACPTSGRLKIGTVNPVLSAVFPDADTDQRLTGTFEWLEIPASGGYDDSTPRKPALPTENEPANGTARTDPLTGLEDKKSYAFRVRTRDPDPYFLDSAWSPWCEFSVDTAKPVKPTISPVGIVGGPGSNVTFRLVTGELDVTKFRFGWTYPPTQEVAAVAAWPPSMRATVTLTIPNYGENKLYAYAIDDVNNTGLDASYVFTASRPSPPIAQWGLESYPGETEAMALQDKQPALAGDTPLTATGLGWASQARLIGGKAANVGGGTRLETAAAVVDTTRSFSVAGWYRRTGTTDERAVLVAQDAAGGGLGFALFYFPPYGTWAFIIADQSGGGAHTQPYALSQAAEWIHVAGVYDAPAKEVRLYLNGSLADTKPMQTPAQSLTGKLKVGTAGTTSPWAGSGQAADVRVYDRALVADDFTGKPKSDPTSGGFDEPGMLGTTQVGNWDFEAAVPCYDPNTPNTCEAPDASAWNRKLTLTVGADIGSGHRGSALLLDNTETAATAGPLLLTQQGYTVSAWVYLPAGVTGHRTVLSQQEPGVGSAMFLSYDPDDKWHFWLGEKADVAFSARTVASQGPAERDRWVHLVGVFDPMRGNLRLYVNGGLQGTSGIGAPWQANGQFVVGSFNWRGIITHHWQGGIDDVAVFRGAMTDAAVKTLFEQQSS